ncbi:MAG: hypothetical protein KME07_03825 [Pegethrix bostrychoides GSE-TBD4-15B]|jgi:hypothetical protein|uniref:Uncharacterized protein n=1 Tax=Pegethrix bostrychoides GSE-TBD4-15B TaxID=2839662 RepID=A0A951P7L1_9CYAN|nr:hypothetical protein [Pegethrix bostrychoides GSE-TBD4-15B]
MNETSQTQSDTNRSDAPEDAAMRAIEATHEPQAGLEKARNAAEGKADNAAGGAASSTAQEHIPSNSDPEASDLPSAGRPMPD